jgi:AcrR family transcriptional regulator
VADDIDATLGRRPRADALRNRLRLLSAAKAAFADKGAGASLEEIARAAGVGIGTLYRNFSTRDALIEAVYRNETAQLCAAADRLAETHPPVPALREWLILFVDYLAAKQGMSAALSSLVGGTSGLYAASGSQMQQAATRLVERAVASGEIQVGLDPMDLLRALAGLKSSTDAARRLVDILIAGMRTGR